jgi:uncharacterized protein
LKEKIKKRLLMKIDLTKLIYNQVKEIEINGLFLIKKELWQETDIIDLKEITVFGRVYKDINDDINLELEAKGIMVLKDTKTLEPIDYPYNVEIEEKLDENNEIKQNILDIEPILWENVLLEVPIRIVNNENPINLKGEGWELKDN